MAKDLLSEYQQNELKRLARFALSPLQLTIVIGILFCFAMVIIGALIRAPSDPAAVEEQRRELVRIDTSWTNSLIEAQSEHADWLQRRGISIEQNLYTRISYRVLESALTLADYTRGGERAGGWSTFLIFILGAVLRVGFLLIAAARLLLACIIYAWWASHRSSKPYAASDALGQTGNGRLFFSGIRVDLDERAKDGSPSRQVAGLACPERVPLSSVQASPIAKILTSYNASNPVNLALASIILRYHTHPDHLAFAEDQTRFDHCYETGTLGSYVETLLPAVLEAHRKIVVDEELSEHPHQDQPESSNQLRYAKLVQDILGRVLSPRVRGAMATVSPAEVATMCLALEAGKILLFVFEGGRWNRRSHFPELSARAMLHSCPEFSESYDSIIRARLRRALVFSGEPSVFAPIRLPQDLTLESQGLLSFARVLLAPPHELQYRAVSEELSGLLAHVHVGFEKVFFASAGELDPDLLEDAYTCNNVLLIKLPKIMTILRQVIDSSLLRRLHELAGLMQTFTADKEQLDSLQDDTRSTTGSHDTILPQLRDDEVLALSSQYKLPETEIRDWGVLRLALYHFGWLGRRVSERTVPNSSIVFAAIKADTRTEIITGLEGVVPLRATRCREHWGKQWASRFIEVDWARIAESRRDFERLLAGEITDAIPGDEDGDDESIVGAAS